ncbi:hypothetical protein ENSA5_21260 [Enhygromyxa salina]|uniref:WAP domain-containing protein n=1 Tax=Enhygromyxa salina TaxID=215803 RepID=A0A2S9YCF5_9BACT|nr:hypothetical protein [Enhygromyxa salina]PRQ02773.1 hypothetical protein ENSA5_21260 [Enhygromyxa salina]
MLRERAIGGNAPVALLLGTLGILGALGCSPQVGDPCKRATDCGLDGVRQCDVSNASRDPDQDGECIVENCSFGVCPSEAVCVKVYASDFVSIACDPDTEDIGSDNCLPNEVCLPEGLCADEIRARTSCRRKCKTDSNCRSNYKCEETGVGGVYVAPDPSDPTRQLSAKICVPR